jgi:hypothetical protein
VTDEGLPPPPQQPGPSRGKAVALVAAVGGIIVGAAIGFAVGDATEAESASPESTPALDPTRTPQIIYQTRTITAGPTVTETETVQPTVTETETRTRTRTVEAQPDAARSFGDGVWVVGEEVAPGTYRAPGGSGCYWARLRNFSAGLNSIIANGGFSRNQTVTIQASDAGFETTRCGTWTRI